MSIVNKISALMNFVLQRESQPLMSPLFLFGAPPRASLTQREECYLLLPQLISSPFFSISGEALQHGPFQQLPPNNKNIVLYHFTPPYLSGAFTLPYSA